MITRVSLPAAQRAAKHALGAFTGPISDGRLRVDLTDEGLTFSCRTPEHHLSVQAGDESERATSVLVLKRMLLDFIGDTTGEDLVLELRDGSAVARAGASELEVQTYDIDDWHVIEHATSNRIEWPPDICATLDRVAHAAGDEKAKAVLQGVSLRNGRAAATDSYQLAAVEVPLPSSTDLLLPAVALRQLSRLHDGLSTIQVTSCDNCLTFSADRWQLSTTLMVGAFPEWEQHIPAPTEPTIRLYRDQLLTALRRIRLVAGKDQLNCVRLSRIDEKTVQVWAQLPDYGHQEDVIDGVSPFEVVAFNLDNLTNAVEYLNEDLVGIEMDSPLGRAVMRTHDYLALVQPIRL